MLTIKPVSSGDLTPLFCGTTESQLMYVSNTQGSLRADPVLGSLRLWTLKKRGNVAMALVLLLKLNVPFLRPLTLTLAHKHRMHKQNGKVKYSLYLSLRLER